MWSFRAGYDVPVVRSDMNRPAGRGSSATSTARLLIWAAGAVLVAYAFFALAWPAYRLVDRFPSGVSADEWAEWERIGCIRSLVDAIPDDARIEYVGDVAIDQRIVELGYPRLRFTGPAAPTYRIVTPAPSTPTGSVWTCGERSYEVTAVGG